jgi:nucleoside-diphosphate-sugar epimerase
VDSLRHVLAFAHAGRERGVLRKLEHLSTVGVAGRMSGLVPEAPLSRPRRFHNTYEAAKAEAEELLMREMDAGLAATIHRPSMVVGDARTGRIIHFQVFYHLGEFLAGSRTGGIVPDAGPVRIDIIPADWVARVIHASSVRPDAVGRIFHLCAGPAFALTVNEMGERLHALLARRGRRMPRLRRVPLGWFRRLLPVARLVAPAQGRRFLAALPRLLEYFDEAQVFDNVRTRAFFTGAGLEVPAVDDYLDKVIDFYCDARDAAGSRRSAAPRE